MKQDEMTICECVEYLDSMVGDDENIKGCLDYIERKAKAMDKKLREYKSIFEEKYKEKTAEQMFNDLDYKKIIKDGCIRFERHNENVIEWLIEFDLEINTVYVSWFGNPKDITLAELRAINKQCEELNWL